jgi:hypothetical protein
MFTHTKKLHTAATWMWERRGKNLFWRPLVLTEINNDPTSPKLNAVEAHSIFRLLEEQKLIFPSQEGGQTAYYINEVKEKEWNTFLRELNPYHRFFIRPLLLFFKQLWTAILWLISIVIASVIGAFFGEWIKALFHK